MERRKTFYKKHSVTKAMARSLAMLLIFVLLLSGTGMTVFAEAAGEMIAEDAKDTAVQEKDDTEPEAVVVENGEVQATLPTIVREDNYGSLHWSVDSDGKLLITQLKEDCEIFDSYIEPWIDYWDLIHEVEIDANCFMKEENGNMRLAISFEFLPEVYYGPVPFISKISFGENFDSSSITDMSNLFASQAHIEEIDFTNFNTSNVTNMSGMFGITYGYGKVLDLSSFDMSKVEQGFTVPSEVEVIYTPKNLGIDIFIDSFVEEGTDTVYEMLPQNLDYSIKLVKKVTEQEAEDTEETEEPEIVDPNASTSGTYGSLSWKVENGCLTITQEANAKPEVFEDYAYDSMMDWYVHHNNIEKIVIDAAMIAKRTFYRAGEAQILDCFPLQFGAYPNLKEIEFGDKLDTSLYQSFSEMFAECKNLEQVNLSSFNTSNAVSMNAMFRNCEKLTEIDVSGFNTSKVQDLSYMFYNCCELSSVELLGFDVSNVKTMDSMFADCKKLQSAEFGRYMFSSIEDISNMFLNCSSITHISFGKFTTERFTKIKSAFQGCTKLKTLDMVGLDMYMVEDISYLFSGCESLERLYLKPFDLSCVKYAVGAFEDCDSLSSILAPTYLYMDSLALPVTDYDQRWYRVDTWEEITCVPYELESRVQLQRYDEPIPTTISLNRSELLLDCDETYWFDVSIKPLRYDFEVEWSSSNEDIVSVDEDGAIKGMAPGTAVITAKLVGESDIVAECSVTVEDLIDSGRWGEKTYWTLDKENNLVITQDRGVDYEYFYDEEEPWLNYTDTIKTMHIDATCLAESGDGARHAIQTWDESVNSGYPISRYQCLEKITFGDNFSPENITDMSRMFAWCMDITELDLSNFVTDSAVTMKEMFLGCYKLSSLNISTFNTSNVTDMSYMFATMPALQNLTLGYIDTSSVDNMNGMFSSCSSIESLDISVLNMDSVTEADLFFEGCLFLHEIKAPAYLAFEGIELPSFADDQKWVRTDTGEEIEYLPTNLEETVTLQKGGEVQLAEMKLSREELLLDINKGYPLRIAESGLTSDKAVIWTSADENVAVVTQDGVVEGIASGTTVITACLEGTSIKAECTVTVADLTASGIWGENIYWTLDKDGNLIITQDEDAECEVFDYYEEIPWIEYASQVKSMLVDATYYLADEYEQRFLPFTCENEYGSTVPAYPNMKELRFGEGFDSSYLKDMSMMFYGCNRIEYLDLSNFDTSNVTNLDYMFYECSNLKTLDLRSFDTSQVESMRYMFYGCSSLTDINLSSFDTANVDNMNMMFNGCKSLKYIGMDTFDTSNVTDLAYMFYGCSSLMELNLSNFNTEKVEHMEGMFYGCSNLIILDLASFNTENVTDMGAMFTGCSSLQYFYNISFDTSCVTRMQGMFMDCTNLKSLDLHSFNTSNVAMMGEMFKGCKSLTRIDISNFDLSGLHQYYEDEFFSEEAMDAMFERDKEQMKNLFAGCDSLETILTPIHLSVEVDLPATYVDTEGNEYEQLPCELDKYVTLIVSGFGVQPIADQIYTGSAVKPEIKVMQGAKKLTEGVDYTVSYKNNVKAASKDAVDKKGKSIAPTVTVKGKGNYGGTVTATFNILPATVTGKDVVVSNNITTQSSKQQLLKPTVTVFGKKLKLNADYIIEYVENDAEGAFKNPGSHTINIDFIGNYTGTVPSEIVILAKDQIKASQLKIGKIATYNYNEGRVIEPAPSVSYKGKELVAGEDYAFSYKNNILPGKATLIITGLRNADGTFVVGEVTKTFTIKGTPISKAKIEYNSEYVYTGKMILPEITVKVGSGNNAVELEKDKDYSVYITNAVNAGKATLSIIGQGGYTGQVKKTFKIVPWSLDEAEVTAQIAGGNAVAYLASGVKPQLKVWVASKELISGKDYTVSYKNNKKLASASDTKAPTLTLKGKGNYKFTKTLTFDIVKRDLGDESIVAASTDVLASAKSKLSAPVVTDAAGKKLKANKDYTVSYTVDGNAFDGKNAAAGTVVTVAVVAKADSNYTGQTETTYRIVENDINKTKIIIAKQAYKDGEAIEFTEEMIEGGAITITNSKTKEPLVYGTDYEIVGYKNNTKKGSATVIIKGIGKYGKTRNVKFSITSKNL